MNSKSCDWLIDCFPSWCSSCQHRIDHHECVQQSVKFQLPTNIDIDLTLTGWGQSSPSPNEWILPCLSHREQDWSPSVSSGHDKVFASNAFLPDLQPRFSTFEFFHWLACVSNTWIFWMLKQENLKGVFKRIYHSRATIKKVTNNFFQKRRWTVKWKPFHLRSKKKNWSRER